MDSTEKKPENLLEAPAPPQRIQVVPIQPVSTLGILLFVVTAIWIGFMLQLAANPNDQNIKASIVISFVLLVAAALRGAWKT